MKLGNLREVLLVSTLLLHFTMQCCGHTFSDYSLKIEPRRMCLRPGGQLNVSCSLYYSGTRNGSTTNYENWTLVWYHNGKTLVGTTLSSERGHARVLVNRITAYSTGQFTCVSRNQESVWQNRSVFVKPAPRAVEKLQQKPVHKYKNYNRRIEISWRSFNPGDYSYELVPWWSSLEDEDLSSIGVTCDWSICNGYFETDGVTFQNVSFYITTRATSGCEAKSSVWTYFVSDNRKKGVENLLLLSPQTPDHLYITTALRKVILKWDDDIQYYYYSAYSYQYNSSQNSIKRKETKLDTDVETPSIELTDKDIHPYIPYKEYTFCIQLQWYSDGAYSKPRCNTTRLHEDIPTAAPTITCTSETCPMADDGNHRNVTITWKLPTEESWNGVLNELKLVYYSLAPYVSTEISIRNLSTSSVILRGLNLTKTYTVSMQACTEEGCSENGNTVLIPAESFSKRESTSSSNIIISICTVVGCILVIAVFLMCAYLRPHCRGMYLVQQAVNLPKLDPPAGPDEHIYCYPVHQEIFDQYEPNTKEKNDTNANTVEIVCH